MAKRYHVRRIKIHRTYTIAEAAESTGAHRHTVRRWIAAKLPTTDSESVRFLFVAQILRSCERANRPSSHVGPESSFASAVGHEDGRHSTWSTTRAHAVARPSARHVSDL